MPRMVAGGLAVAGCLALSFPPPAVADTRRGPGHVAYDVALSWHAHDRRLDGTERVSFENTRGRAIRSVWVRLWANGVASCDHPRISAKVLAGGHAADSAAACTALKVRLARDLTSGKRATIRLRFSVRVPSGNGSLGHSPGGPTLLGNALPILAVTDRGGTHLEPYSRIGEAGYSLTSSWHVRLDLRRGLAAATTGVQAGRGAISATTRRLRFEA